MRLRVLELPKRQLGQAVETPFLLVVDRIGNDDLTESWRGSEGFSAQVGAAGTVVFRDEIDLEGALVFTDPEARPIIEAAAKKLGITPGSES